MTPAEALVLTRLARASCPQQKFDEYTPDAWAELLADLDFDDARTAVVTVVKRQPFVAPSEIRAEVHRTRSGRLAEQVDDMPDADPDDVAAYLDALRTQRHRVADGTERHRPAEELAQAVADVRTLPPPDSPPDYSRQHKAYLAAETAARRAIEGASA